MLGTTVVHAIEIVCPSKFERGNMEVSSIFENEIQADKDIAVFSNHVTLTF